jgi:hypothetical protein
MGFIKVAFRSAKGALYSMSMHNDVGLTRVAFRAPKIARFSMSVHPNPKLAERKAAKPQNNYAGG